MIRFVAAVVVAVAVAVGTIWLALIRLPEDLEGVGRVLAILFTVLVGSKVFFSEAGKASERYRIERNKKNRSRAEAALKAAYLRIVRQGIHGLDPADVGLSAFYIRWRLCRVWRRQSPTPGLRGWRGWVSGLRFVKPWRKELVRLGRWRLTPTPLPSRVRWTCGKGAIGQAWETGRYANHLTEAEWATMPNDRATYEALPPERRKGITYSDYRALRGKYKGCAAVPVIGGADVVGVVAVDLRQQNGRTDLELLSHADVTSSLEELAASITGVVERG
jgi:hypothetical protein